MMGSPRKKKYTVVVEAVLERTIRVSHETALDSDTARVMAIGRYALMRPELKPASDFKLVAIFRGHLEDLS